MSEDPLTISGPTTQRRPGASPLLILAILLVGGITLFLVWYIPDRRRSVRAANERAVFIELKALASLEADVRHQDLDGNGVKDFWTGDLAGLFAIGSLKRELAEADVNPLTPLCPRPVPYRGHYFVALQVDYSTRPPVRYGQDTDQKSGKVHHLERFGFLAYPAERGVTGNYYFMINENNTVVRASATLPLPKDWPTDAEFQQHWCKPR